MKDAKTEAIRRAYAKLGRNAKYQDVIDHVRRASGNFTKPGLIVTRQKVHGVKSRITEADWRGWADVMRKVGVPKLSPVTEPEPPTTAVTDPRLKRDWEIVALLNTAVDKYKLARLLNTGDMARLDATARAGGLAFDEATCTFGLPAVDGGFCVCNI